MVALLREWVTSVVIVTLLLSVAQTLIPEGGIRRIASFTVGLILLAALLRPVLGTDLSRLELSLEDYGQAVEERRAELERERGEELSGLIARQTAAYISDKAGALGLSVTARVTVEPDGDGIPVPAAAELTGQRSEALAAYLEQELGIPRERQVWKDEGTT